VIKLVINLSLLYFKRTFVIELMEINTKKSNKVKFANLKSEQDQETYSVPNRRLEIVE